MNEKKSVHKLKKSSAYSYAVTLPKEMVEKYGWKEHQKLVISDKGNGKIEICDWPARNAMHSVAGRRKK